MPSSETITSFYVFSSGSIARAEDVNVNFSVFRGHLLPVDPTLSAAATTKTYDLGSSEHRWGVAYLSQLDISQTTTQALIVAGLSAGAWTFNMSGSSAFQINDSGYIGFKKTPMSVQNPTATVGNIAARSTLNTTITTSGHLANTTCTLQTLGRPVMLELGQVNQGNANFISVQDNTTGSSEEGFAICFVLDGIVGAPLSVTKNAPDFISFPAETFYTIDTPNAGYHTYSLYVTLTGGVYIKPENIRLTAREI